jgi:hypothetical protein
MRTWHDAVKAVIAEQCAEAYRMTNTTRDGKYRRRHVPYSVPPLAQAMVRALDRDDEHEGKRLLLLYRTGALSLI